MQRLGTEWRNLKSGPIFVIAIRAYDLRHIVFGEDYYARMVNLYQDTSTILSRKTLDQLWNLSLIMYIGIDLVW